MGRRLPNPDTTAVSAAVLQAVKHGIIWADGCCWVSRILQLFHYCDVRWKVSDHMGSWLLIGIPDITAVPLLC